MQLADRTQQVSVGSRAVKLDRIGAASRKRVAEKEVGCIAWCEDTASMHLLVYGDIAMPFGDRTGPRGLGPMTGRGRGQCAVAWPREGFSGAYERGGAFGTGGGKGWKHWYRATGLPGWARAGRGRFEDPRYSPGTPQDELNYLKEYILGLEEALNVTRARMAELEKSGQAE